MARCPTPGKRMRTPPFWPGWDFKHGKHAASLATFLADGICLFTNINYTIILRVGTRQQNDGRKLRVDVLGDVSKMADKRSLLHFPCTRTQAHTRTLLNWNV